MKHKTIKTDKATLLVVELPEGSRDIVVTTFNRIGFYLPNGISSYEMLPEGNWQLIGRLPEIMESQAIELVDSYEVSHNLDLTATLAFKDYNNGISEDENVDYDYWDEYPFDTAIQSLSSLLQANDVYFENILGESKICSCEGACPSHIKDECYVEYLEWEEAQSKVWDKERTFLFIKVE